MGILLVYDVTDEKSFSSESRCSAPPSPNHFRSHTTLTADIRTWHSNIEQHASPGVNKILIGNKCDWSDKKVITEQQGQELAEELGLRYLETSAKTNINVEEAFFALARYVASFFPPCCLLGLARRQTGTIAEIHVARL